MKYRKNGRTYRLVGSRGEDSPCIFCADGWCSGKYDSETEDEFEDSSGCREGMYWRETLFSKIRNWRRKG